MLFHSKSSRVSPESLRISSIQRPGWETPEGRVPEVGQFVHCMEGPARVVRVLGRTSDGSRLLELRREDRREPFFASSSNVLLQTGAPDDPPSSPAPDDESGR